MKLTDCYKMLEVDPHMRLANPPAAVRMTRVQRYEPDPEREARRAAETAHRVQVEREQRERSHRRMMRLS